MMNFISRYSIPIILTMKVAVITYIYWGDKAFLWIGEKNAAAQAEAASKSPAPTGEAADSEQDKEAAPRKGYLDDLLTLPKIDAENLKKDEVGRYLTQMERKQSQIESRMEVLKSRETQLKSLELSIDQKIKKLEEEMQFFQGTIQKEKQIQAERLDKLVEFYQKMEVKKAAPVFEKLDKDLVVSLFNKIPQKQTTQILGLMNADRSVELSEYYGRIRSAKEYDLLKEINTALRKEFEECKGMPQNLP